MRQRTETLGINVKFCSLKNTTLFQKEKRSVEKKTNQQEDAFYLLWSYYLKLWCRLLICFAILYFPDCHHTRQDRKATELSGTNPKKSTLSLPPHTKNQAAWPMLGLYPWSKLSYTKEIMTNWNHTQNSSFSQLNHITTFRTCSDFSWLLPQ